MPLTAINVRFVPGWCRRNNPGGDERLEQFATLWEADVDGGKRASRLLSSLVMGVLREHNDEFVCFCLCLFGCLNRCSASFVFFSLSLSLSLVPSLSLRLCSCQFVCLFVCLSVCQTFDQSVNLFVNLCVDLCLCVCLSVCPSVCLYVCLSVCSEGMVPDSLLPKLKQMRSFLR